MTSLEYGNIENVVSSTGTMEALGTVNVLSQMTGTVEAIHADFNDRVEKGQGLIDLNTDILAIQTRAAAANVREAAATAEHTRLEYNNNLALYKKSLLSEFDLHASATSLEIALAKVESAEAQLEELRIELDQYALVLAPITGIVLGRSVDVGDTVMGGSSATTLFTLARDLSNMEIQARVDELDIGEISSEQHVRFTVDAFPDEEFEGTVRQVRLVPESADNVVTYTVIIDAENRDGMLLPGMTAAVDFLVESRENVLLVPNGALRFTPTEELVRRLNEQSAGSGGDQQKGSMLPGISVMGGGPPGTGRPPGGSGSFAGSARSANGGNGKGSPQAEKPQVKTIWTLDEQGTPVPVMVKTGISDGVHTEVSGPELNAGLKVIERLQVAGNGNN